MAARKSCAHLTWAEAKAKIGGDSGTGVKKKKGEKPKKLNHMEKIIAKSTGTTTKESQAKERKELKSQRRQEEKLIAIAERRSEERRLALQKPKVKPYEQVKERMESVASERKTASCENDGDGSTESEIEDEGMMRVFECRETQLSEIEALEAMFADSNDLVVCDSSRLDDLRETIDYYRNGDQDDDLVRSVFRHSPTRLLLKLEILDEDGRLSSRAMTWSDDDDDDERDLVLAVLLEVTLPPTYPSSPLTEEANNDENDATKSPVPKVEIAFFACTDRSREVAADKPFESLVRLREIAFAEALQTQMGEILPDLSVYEVCVTWASENIFDFVA